MCRRAGSCIPSHDQEQIPGNDLAHPGYAHDRLAPPGVVAGQRLNHLDIVPRPDQPHDRSDVHSVEVVANAMLGLAAMSPGIAPSCEAGSEQVPRRHLVTTPGRVPVRVRQVDEAAWFRSPDELVDQTRGVGYVFENV